jgi:AcrR family transcriptional regulator
MKSSAARIKILQAAKNRFGYYGFKKTNMAEIAGDCDMSAANIYRHFTGKDDIIAALAVDVFGEEEKQLALLCSGNFPDSSQKLQAFFMEAFLQTHRYITEKPKMKEMVDYICEERVDLVTAHKEIKQKLIASILQEGVDSGEFRIKNVEEMAITFKSATVMFHTPLFFNLCNFDELKAACTDVVSLLLTAICSLPQESS